MNKKMETIHTDIRTTNVKILAKVARTNALAIKVNAFKNFRVATYKKYMEPIKTSFVGRSFQQRLTVNHSPSRTKILTNVRFPIFPIMMAFATIIPNTTISKTSKPDQAAANPESGVNKSCRASRSTLGTHTDPSVKKGGQKISWNNGERENTCSVSVNAWVHPKFDVICKAI
jgi:hypothetical protein